MVTLENLSISGNSRITDAGLKCMANLTRLQQVSMNSCKNITSRGLAHMCNLPIVELSLVDCDMGDECLTVICTMGSLKKLDIRLSCNRITDVGIENLAAATKLDCLNI